jgi:cyanophycinase
MGGGQDPHGLVRPIFVALAGARDARIVSIPVASRLTDSRTYYPELFQGLGASDSWIVDPDESQVNDPIVRPSIEAATGVFLAGGDQKLLCRKLRGTLTAQVMLDCLRSGRPLLTTSAGTNALSDMMIAGLDDDDSVRIMPGLGWLPGITFETHVDTRDRYARLAEVFERRINPVVVGIDENTALVFTPHTARARVVGAHGVSIHSVRIGLRWCGAGEEVDFADLLPDW